MAEQGASTPKKHTTLQLSANEVPQARPATFITEVPDSADNREQRGDKSGTFHVYKELINRINFKYEYEENTPVRPLLKFYEVFRCRACALPKSRRPQSPSRPRGGELRIVFPETILFTYSVNNDGEKERMAVHVFTDADGVVRCHAVPYLEFPTRGLLRRWEVSADSPIPVAVLKKATRRNPFGNDILLFNGADLTSLLNGDLSDHGETFALQRFVRTKGAKASVSRVQWRRGRPACAWVICNRDRFGDPSDVKQLNRTWRTQAENNEEAACTVVQQSGRGTQELGAMAGELVAWLERCSTLASAGVVFEELVLDFAKDLEGGWQCLQVKAFRLSEAPRRVFPEEGADGSPAEETPVGLKPYRKTGRCGMCRSEVLPEELSCQMTTLAILQTTRHIKNRGIQVRCFSDVSDERIKHLAGVSTAKYQHHRVCRVCYELYHAELQLADVEVEFAKALGIPISEERPRSLELPDSYYGPRRREMGAGGADLSRVADARGLPRTMARFRLLVYVHGLWEVQELAPDVRYYLEYEAMGQRVRYPVSIARGALTSPVHRLRVYYFFCAEETFKGWIGNKPAVPFALYAPGRRLVGSIAAPIRYSLAGDVAQKADSYQPMASPLGPSHSPCDIKVSIGLEMTGEIETASVELRYWNGLYLPDEEHFTPQPLPDSWVAIMPQDKRRRGEGPAPGAARPHVRPSSSKRGATSGEARDRIRSQSRRPESAKARYMSGTASSKAPAAGAGAGAAGARPESGKPLGELLKQQEEKGKPRRATSAPARRRPVSGSRGGPAPVPGPPAGEFERVLASHLGRGSGSDGEVSAWSSNEGRDDAGRKERRRRYEEQRAAVEGARRSQRAAEVAEGKDLAGRANESAMGSRAVLEALLRGSREAADAPESSELQAQLRVSLQRVSSPAAGRAGAGRGRAASPLDRPGPEQATPPPDEAAAAAASADLDQYERRVRRLLMALEERLEHRARAYTGDIMTSGRAPAERGDALRRQLSEAQREIGELRRIIEIQSQLVAEMRAADADGAAGERRAQRDADSLRAVKRQLYRAERRVRELFGLLEGGSEAGDAPVSPASSQARSYGARAHSPHGPRRARASPAAKTGPAAPVQAAGPRLARGPPHVARGPLSAAAMVAASAAYAPGASRVRSPSPAGGRRSASPAASGDERASVASSAGSSRGGGRRPRPASAGGRVRHRPPPIELDATREEEPEAEAAGGVPSPQSLVSDHEMANIRALTQQAHRHGMHVTKVQSQVTRDGQRRLVLYF